MRIYCFPLTAVWNAGMSQIFCGAAAGKTRGSPCLGGYKINGPMEGSHAALSLDLRMLPWVTKVLRSAWMPAPPPESEPGLER
jgi:hypothetical protein